METRTKIGKVVKEFECHNVRIERVRVLYLLVPSIVDNFHNEVFAHRVRRFVEGTVVPLGLVIPFFLTEFCPSCIPVDCVII